jgi:hypothetical protein
MMGFAAIGLYLIYLAYRYNIMFVLHTTIDTRGRAYARALQHTTVGIYIALVCNIGLFAVAQAPGPTVLTAIYLIGSILFHVSFRSAIGPLIDTLPKSLEVEEEHLLALEKASGATSLGHEPETHGAGHKNGTNGTNGAQSIDDEKKNGLHDPAVLDHGALSLPAPHKKPNFLTKWLHPEKYTDYQTLRRMVPRNFAEIVYDQQTERDAYYNPSVAAQVPMLWVPRDSMGVSRQEVAHSNGVVPMSDECAGFDDKGKVTWDQDSRPPIWEEKIYY